MIYTRPEVDLYNALRRHHARYTGKAQAYRLPADEVAEILGLDDEDAQNILESWVDRGWWECGVSERTGWFTSDAPEKLP